MLIDGISKRSIGLMCFSRRSILMLSGLFVKVYSILSTLNPVASVDMQAPKNKTLILWVERQPKRP